MDDKALEEKGQLALDNFECSSQLHLSESDREAFLLNVMPILREVAEEARRQAEEMLREEHDARMEAVTALDVEKALHADTRAKLSLIEGAMRADDKRLEDAALEVWGEHRWGCDTPEQMADTISNLRAKLAEAQREINRYQNALTAVVGDKAHVRSELAAARERERVLREAVAAWRHSPSLPDCLACSVFDAHPGSALRREGEK